MIGRPDMDLVSTSYVERSNLTLRMQNRRFTRLTNAFSKKAENHAHAVSLFFLYYNYCRPHQTLTKAANGTKTTPAMAATARSISAVLSASERVTMTDSPATVTVRGVAGRGERSRAKSASRESIGVRPPQRGNKKTAIPPQSL